MQITANEKLNAEISSVKGMSVNSTDLFFELLLGLGLGSSVIRVMLRKVSSEKIIRKINRVN